MSMYCCCCGNAYRSVLKEPFYLSNDKILCDQCAKPIVAEMERLYSINNKQEFDVVKAKIVEICQSCYSMDITKHVVIIIDKLYKRAFPSGREYLPQNNYAPITAYTASNAKETPGMFSNIGQKIKMLANALAWIGIIASIYFGVFLMIDIDVLTGVVVLLGGSLFSWLGSFLLYGFGQLVDNSDKIRRMMENK